MLKCGISLHIAISQAFVKRDYSFEKRGKTTISKLMIFALFSTITLVVGGLEY